MMDRLLAEALMRGYLEMGGPFNRLAELSKQLDTPDAHRVRQVIGELHSKIYADLMIPIIREYPDLDPDKPSQP
jgi:hypothetical protein